MFNNSGGAGGSYWPNVATSLMATLGVPVAFVMANRDGSGLVSSNGNTQWTPLPSNHLDRTALYGSMVYRAQLAGSVRAVLWHQGETDGIESVSQPSYTTGMATLAAAIMADLGCKLMPAKVQQGSSYPNIGPINAAITAEWASDANVLKGPDFSDLTADDGLHFHTDADMYCLGSRWAQAIMTAFFTGPMPASSVAAGPTPTTLTVHDTSGNPLANFSVVVCSDTAGLSPVTGVLYTNASGQFTANLTTGTTYYVRGQDAAGHSLGGTSSTPTVQITA